MSSRRLARTRRDSRGKRRDEKAARNYLAWAQEQEDKHGTLHAAKLAGQVKRVIAGADAPVATCDAWFDAWERSREAKGLTSTRDNRAHYTFHIRPALNANHVRDWTPEDMRALVRDLDGKVQRGEIHWKHAKNVWGTATKMAADAVSSKLARSRSKRSTCSRVTASIALSRMRTSTSSTASSSSRAHGIEAQDHQVDEDEVHAALQHRAGPDAVAARDAARRRRALDAARGAAD